MDDRGRGGYRLDETHMISAFASRSERCIAVRRVSLRGKACLLFVLAGCAVLAGCTATPDGPPTGGPIHIGADAGTECAHPGEGCACSPEQPPIDCYLEPTYENGRLMCSRGTRYCRSGVWTRCESVRTYELRSGPGIAPLLGVTTECNRCDPACAMTEDTPDAADLPGRSIDVEYDPIGGGIRIERLPGTVMPELPDSDGDGIPDIADECVGPGALPAADGSCYGDTFFFHELPYGGPAEIDPLDVGIQVRTADVYFLMDTTGSMGGEISNLRSSLRSGTYIPGCSGGIIGAIRCTIPDAWFGVGYHDDYPVSPYGSWGDEVYRNLQDITSDVSAAQNAVNSLPLHGGNDGPESQTQALWAIASGGGLGSYLSSRTCSAGRWGYPCFRPGTIPIVILFTDAPFHNGPNGNNYSSSFGATPLPSPSSVSGNEDMASAYDVGDAATSWTGFSGNTCGMSDDHDLGCVYDYAGDAVYRFTVSTRSSITITTEGSSFDTAISLRNSSFGEVTCNDDGGSGYTSKIVRTLDPGTYYVVISSYYSTCGSYRLSIGNTAFGGGYPVSWAQTVSALNANGVRVITIHSGAGYGIEDARDLADATGSLSGSGARYVFEIPTNGSGLSTAVVDAVVDLANYNRMDIGARAVDNPATAGVDERGFVESITARGWGPGSCTGTSGGHTFVDCLPGTHVDFRIAFRNDFVMPTTSPQVFDFWIEVVGDGTFVLERIPVRIVVPSSLPAYPASGRYWRDYDSTDHCEGTERPDWNDLEWEAPSIPAGTSIRWEVRASDTLAGLDTATPVTFTTPPTESPVDLGARLVSAGVGNYLPYLRLTAVLLANDARTTTPTLRSFSVRYTCIPQE